MPLYIGYAFITELRIFFFSTLRTALKLLHISANLQTSWETEGKGVNDAKCGNRVNQKKCRNGVNLKCGNIAKLLKQVWPRAKELL